MKRWEYLDKKSLKRQVRIYRFWAFFFMFSSLAFCFILYSYQHTKDNPSFILTKEYIKGANETFKYYGQYSRTGLYGANQIVITIGSADVERAVYHEYAHWIYYKKLTKEERYVYDNLLCDTFWTMEGYTAKDACPEQFARQMSDYMNEMGWHYNPSASFEDRELLFRYIDKVFKKYVG